MLLIQTFQRCRSAIAIENGRTTIYIECCCCLLRLHFSSSSHSECALAQRNYNITTDDLSFIIFQCYFQQNIQQNERKMFFAFFPLLLLNDLWMSNANVEFREESDRVDSKNDTKALLWKKKRWMNEGSIWFRWGHRLCWGLIRLPDTDPSLQRG